MASINYFDSSRKISTLVISSLNFFKFHLGTNLKPCIYDMVKNSRGLLGSQRFRCKQNGEYEKIQCHVRECWCVDEMGVERTNTRVYIGPPVCDGKVIVLIGGGGSGWW
jgi:hypothetical protein